MPELGLGEVAAYAMSIHEDDVDKAGAPYVGHLMRVWHNVWSEDGSLEQQMAALLHDTLEDHPSEVTAAGLLNAGVPRRVVTVVELLTKSSGKMPPDYYARIRDDPDARAVKLADVRDNSDPTRLAALPAAQRRRLIAKYEHAIRQLRG